MTEPKTQFVAWMAQLDAARANGTLKDAQARIELEIAQTATERFAVSAGVLGPSVFVRGSNAAKDYLWLRYGAKGVPTTPADFEAMAMAHADLMNVPLGMLRFFGKSSHPSRPEDLHWARRCRLALVREQISLDVELSGQSLLPFIHPSSAAIFKSVIGTSGPILMLTSHLGYRRMRGHMGATLARDVKAAGAGIALDQSAARAVAFESIKRLASGGVLFVAPDGPYGEHRQSVNLKGISIEISTGASRLAYDTKARVVFLSVCYKDGQFSPLFHHGPDVTPTDNRKSFVEKVTRFYEHCLTSILWGPPDQLIIPYTFYPVHTK